MNAEESKNRFISSSEAKEKCRSATISFSKVPVKVIWSVFDEACTLKMEQLADTHDRP